MILVVNTLALYLLVLIVLNITAIVLQNAQHGAVNQDLYRLGPDAKQKLVLVDVLAAPVNVAEYIPGVEWSVHIFATKKEGRRYDVSLLF